MSVLRLLLPIALTLAACTDSGDDAGNNASDDAGNNASDDAGDNASSDAGDNASSDASSDAGSDAGANTGNDSILFRSIVSNGLTGLRIEGGEFCVLAPEQDSEPCGTTNANGIVDWLWLSPSESNFTSRFVLDGYTTMLYLGHWDDQTASFWEEELEATDRITFNFAAFETPVMDQWLGTGQITRQEGAGHIFIFVNGSTPFTAVDGMTASLSDESGTVVYWSDNGQTLNSALTASSTTGHFIIANVPPGTYTLNIEHESLVCDNGFAWKVETPNQYTVPVEADTVTRSGILCTAP